MEVLELGKWNNLTLTAQPETPKSGKWYVALQNTMKTWWAVSDIWPYRTRWKPGERQVTCGLREHDENLVSGKWYVALQNTMKTWWVVSDMWPYRTRWKPGEWWYNLVITAWPETLKWNKCLMAFLHKTEDLERGKWKNLTLTAQPETPTRGKWYVALQNTMKTWWLVDCVWNVMAQAQKLDFVFRGNRRAHLNRQGRQFSLLLAAEVCASAVVMLDTPCTDVVWRVLATHFIRRFPLHFHSRASPCAITFQRDS